MYNAVSRLEARIPFTMSVSVFSNMMTTLMNPLGLLLFAVVVVVVLLRLIQAYKQGCLGLVVFSFGFYFVACGALPLSTILLGAEVEKVGEGVQ